MRGPVLAVGEPALPSGKLGIRVVPALEAEVLAVESPDAEGARLEAVDAVGVPVPEQADLFDLAKSA